MNPVTKLVEDFELAFRDEDELDAVLVDRKLKPDEKYPAREHARAVAKQLGVKEGVIFLPGQTSTTHEDSDQAVSFRQGRYFYYLSGLDFPDCMVTYDISRDALFAWISRPRTGRDVIFNGPSPTREEVNAIADFEEVHYTSSLLYYLKPWGNGRSGKVYLLHARHEPYIKPSRRLKDGTIEYLKHYYFNTTVLKPAMDAARAIKSPYEIELIRKANNITAQAHINVLRGMRKFKNEAEIEAIFAATCISRQAKQQAYEIIAASGSNASTLHYGANNESLEGRQLVCLDAGCEWKCYASDVTRTFPVSGQWTPQAKEIYDLVARMQDECIAMVKPGADYREIHMHAHKVAIEGLMELGLLHNGTFEELYSSGVSLAFFPHGLGHFMGLEVHDVGPGGNLLYSFEEKVADWDAAYFEMARTPKVANPSVLEPNMVITVEPGIYFSKYALQDVYLRDPKFAKYINKDLLDRYYPVGGVRIEDDLLVTEDGYENLTKVPKGDEALRIINDSGTPVVDEPEKRGWLW
ncbi:Uncharacterized protein BP5553_00427 [Venustampulla echinocandica]|uniref:Xaa-Pro aminopeptidase n=1 Tax=Venustampulla echinocandica TaxID=2656787 RepID=A0A370TY58_9HELO|nr:Uncharacterized protein BP5553_00427 [Venustampulla echinocandica]RDL40448.1 Uncharacterized protein BP5553_00427 [Venustampulla echinocandica]